MHKKKRLIENSNWIQTNEKEKRKVHFDLLQEEVTKHKESDDDDDDVGDGPAPAVAAAPAECLHQKLSLCVQMCVARLL